MHGASNERRSAIALTVGGTVALVGVFAPWLRSGTASRSSFELFDLVDRLGFSPSGPFALVLRAWPLVPLLLVGAVVATWAGRLRLGATLGIAAGLYVGLVALGITHAPNAGLIRTTWGVVVSGVGGAASLAASVWLLVATCRSAR